MRKEYTIEKIDRVLNYIEENIKENITLENISKDIKLSKFHLNRVFKSITNEKLMHYVRSRKLTSSLEELKNSDLSVIDIAMEYKFKYEQSYIRSFKKQFSVSPGTFRKEKPTLEIKHKLNLICITPPYTS